MAGITLSYISQIPLTEEGQSIEPSRAEALSFEMAYARVFKPLQDYIFAPLFFASIGYAIVSVSSHPYDLR